MTMNFLSVGDLALTFQNRRHVAQIKSDLARLSEEIASGQKSDLSTLSGGDFLPIASLERSLKANLAYSTAIAEAAMFTSAMQASLEMVQSSSADLGPALLMAGNSEHPTMIRTATADAISKFGAAVSAFNTQVADRYAFSGAATDRPALATADDMLANLQTAIAGQTTAAGVDAALDAWFDTPSGGFETVGYTGSTAQISDFQLSDTDSSRLRITAADPEIREVLKGFALAALAGQGALNGNTVEQAALARRAGERLLSADSALAVLRAQVGTAQAHIEQAEVRNSSEKSALEIARSELTAIDPYRAATQLEATRAQLETLYSLTVRMSRLSLAEFMR